MEDDLGSKYRVVAHHYIPGLEDHCIQAMYSSSPRSYILDKILHAYTQG